MSGPMETREILDMLDLTLLDRGATEDDLDRLCRVANNLRTAAVCVFPEHAGFVRSRLEDGIAIAVVAGGFPEGSASPEEIFHAIEEAVSNGADEIDCVLEPIDSESFPGPEELAKLIAMREASSGLVLKVIVESPLMEERRLRAVTRMVLSSGADFVKSCTGMRGGCSDEDAAVLAEEVHRHCQLFGEERGIKLSGGISLREDVERLIGLVKDRDGSFSGSGRVRIGSSSLIVDLVNGGLGRN